MIDNLTVIVVVVVVVVVFVLFGIVIVIERIRTPMAHSFLSRSIMMVVVVLLIHNPKKIITFYVNEISNQAVVGYKSVMQG